MNLSRPRSTRHRRNHRVVDGRRDRTTWGASLPDVIDLGRRIRHTCQPGEPPWVLAIVRYEPLPDRFDEMLRRLEVVAVLQRSFTRATTLGTLGNECFVALLSDPAEAISAGEEAAAALAASGVPARWRVRALPKDPTEVGGMLQACKRCW
jgi:hypothetical protein